MLETLKPQRVFKHFEDICSIPHGSGNTDAISSYCIDFAKGLLRCRFVNDVLQIGKSK